jgi:HSP20 family protein
MTTSSPIFGLRREIDRLFEDTFARDGNNWTPAVDIKESDNDIRIDLELPGLRPEDVEVTAENGLLTIRGEKRSERKEGDDGRYHVVERSYGTFMRTFTLPQGVDETQIQAEFNDGVLSIRIPKTALPQPRRIQISGNQERQQASVGSGNVSTSSQQRQQSAVGAGNASDSNQQTSGQQSAGQQSTVQQSGSQETTGQQSSQQSTGQQSGGQQSGERSSGRQSSSTSRREREQEQMSAQNAQRNR